MTSTADSVTSRDSSSGAGHAKCRSASLHLFVAARRCSDAGGGADQSVTHIQSEGSGIASAVWVGDMLYVSGQLPTPITPADREKGTPAVYGNTQAQAESTFSQDREPAEGSRASAWATS